MDPPRETFRAKAARYRAKAAQLRALAADIETQEVREHMWSIAWSYEVLAAQMIALDQG
jgi:hypothetical protein